MLYIHYTFVISLIIALQEFIYFTNYFEKQGQKSTFLIIYLISLTKWVPETYQNY